MLFRYFQRNSQTAFRKKKRHTEQRFIKMYRYHYSMEGRFLLALERVVATYASLWFKALIWLRQVHASLKKGWRPEDNLDIFLLWCWYDPADSSEEETHPKAEACCCWWVFTLMEGEMQTCGCISHKLHPKTGPYRLVLGWHIVVG